MLRRYNTRLSVQNVQPLYQLTKEHYLLEGARLLLAAGATAYKFRMEVDKDAVDGNGTRLQVGQIVQTRMLFCMMIF